MKIQIEATTKELKHTSKGAPYTGIKIKDGGWVSVFGDHRGKRGQDLHISEPISYAGTGETKWAKVEMPPGSDPDTSPSPPREEKAASTGKTLQQYFITMDLVFLHVKKLEPDSPEARAILVNGAMAAWIDGKIK